MKHPQEWGEVGKGFPKQQTQGQFFGSNSILRTDSRNMLYITVREKIADSYFTEEKLTYYDVVVPPSYHKMNALRKSLWIRASVK